MREIDDAHQAEDQREAGCYEEIECAKRDPAQKCIQEDLLAAPLCYQFGRPGSQHKPQEGCDPEYNNEGPKRMALDEIVHLGTAHFPVAELRHRWNEG